MRPVQDEALNLDWSKAGYRRERLNNLCYNQNENDRGRENDHENESENGREKSGPFWRTSYKSF